MTSPEAPADITRAPSPGDSVFDVAIIGAGIVGSAIARELGGHRLTVALLEGRDDVGDGTSKANTAILHTGFDARPGTLESRARRRGYELLGGYAPRPVSRSSAPARSWSRGTTRSSTRCRPCRTRPPTTAMTAANSSTPAEVYRQLPHLGPGALGGSPSPTSRSSAPGPPSSRSPPTLAGAGRSSARSPRRPRRGHRPSTPC